MGKMHARVVGQVECCPQEESKCQGIILVCLSILPLRKPTTTQTTCPVVGKAEAARKENGGSAFSASKCIFRDPQEETGAETVW